MQIKIKKNRHYPFPGIPFEWPYQINDIDLIARKAKYMFSDSCMYDLIDEDQHDVNKLFGFSIGWHHENSFRFGWRPILENNTIEIVIYEYINSMRLPTIPICELKLNEWYQFRLQYNPPFDNVYYFVNQMSCKSQSIKNIIKPTKKWGYTLGTYFGGNEKAPQDIIIYKKEAKSWL